MEQITQFIMSLSTLLLSALCFTMMILIIGVFYLVLRIALKPRMLTVSQGRGNDLEGIPFYIKRGRLTQETTYLETLETYTIIANRVMLDDQGKPVGSETEFIRVKTVSQSNNIPELLADLRQKIQEAQSAIGADNQKALLELIKEKFENLPFYTGQLPAPSDAHIESNYFKESSFVDYGTTYYINQLQPLSGKSELEFTLAADGTLQKTVAKNEDSSFDSLMSLLPTDSLISKPKADEEEVSTEEEGRKDYKFEVSLSTEKRYIRHIYSKVLPQETLLPDFFRPAIPLGDNENWYRREIVTDLNPKPKEAMPEKEKLEEKPDQQ
jgi:hypothetical protein